MLQEGAKYFIVFVKNNDDFSGLVQCTKNGKTETFTFPMRAGEYTQDSKFYSVWIGEGGMESSISAEIRKFKCYDESGNNLGAQTNKTSVAISHSGEVENYSKVNGVFYCSAKKALIVLENNKKGYREVDHKKEQFNYIIYNDTQLQLKFNSGKDIYEYKNLIITDGEGNRYQRLKSATVRFVTGDDTITEKVTAENGFRAVKPKDPKKSGNTFMGWYLGNGKQYNFENIVDKSITLYAKWKDGNGNEYIAVDEKFSSRDYKMTIAICISAILVATSTFVCFKIVRRRKNDGNN